MSMDPIVLEKGLQATFFKAYEAGQPYYPSLTTEVPSTARQEKYGWLGSAPIMREWVDERAPKDLLSHEYTLVNKHYEASIKIDSDDLDDDQLGQHNFRVQDMGARAARHPDSLLSTLIVNGESTACYDGQYFFDTDHAEAPAGTSQSNDLTHTVASTALITTAEAKAILNKAIGAMIGFVDDRGEPYMEEWQLNASNFIVMTPTAHREPWEELLTSALISNTDNVYKNRARLIVNARLSSAAKFYFFYTGAPIKPFIFQNRQPVRPGFLGKDSDRGFMRKNLVFGVDARYNVGYGLWQFASLVTIST